MKVSKKKLLFSFSLLLLFILLLFSSSLNARAAQNDDDLEVTLHCRLDSDSSEIQSTLMSPGTYSFFEEPLLDTGEFSHDLSQIEVERLQTQSFNYTNSEDYQFITNINATQGNHSLEFPHSIPEYTIAKELDTTISLNLNYSAINYSSANNFNDPLISDDWELYDEYNNPISLIEGNHDGIWKFNNGSIPSDFIIEENVNTELTHESLIDDHLTVLQLSDDNNNPTNAFCGFKFDLENTLQEHGSFEYYYRTTDSSCGAHMYLIDDMNIPFAYGGSPSIYIAQYNGKLDYWNGASWVTIMTGVQSNQWYHFRIDFECSNGGYKGLSADTYDLYVNDVLKGDDLSFTNPSDYIRGFMITTQNGHYNYDVQVDAFGCTNVSNYELGNNKNHVGVSYGEDSSTQELFLYNSKASQDIHIGLNDTLEIQGYFKCSNELKVKFLEEGSVIHEQTILNNDETQLINESISDSFSFDQLLFQGIHEVDDLFIFENLSISGYSNLPLFDNVYLKNFTYSILGINYTETLEGVLDQASSQYFSQNGTYQYYIDSSMFSEFDRNNDLTIPTQEITVIFDLSSTAGFLFTMNISWSENDWILPTQVDLGINNNDVIDTSLNSGVIYLSSFPETLSITSDSSNILFQLNISISFTLTFDLEIITKTYLRKSFTLLSDHDIIIEKIDLPNNLDLKKVYFNDNSIGTSDPNVLAPEQTMTSGNIYTLEVILDEVIHERLPYISNLASDSYEYLYREYFTYESSDMIHSYHPDSQNQTYQYSNGYLEMKNEFPNEYHEEGWSDWENTFNSSYVSSSASNGNFSNTLNTYGSYVVPDQPEDFTFTNGSFNDTNYGDLNEIDDDHSLINSSAYQASGTYLGWDSFTDDSVGGNPSQWNVGESGSNVVEIVESLDGHSKICHLSRVDGGTSIINDFVPDRTSGTIEFWFRAGQTNKIIYLTFPDASNSLYFYLNSNGYWQYHDGSVHNIATYNADQWYHVRIEFDCSTDWHLWIDDVSKDGGSGYGYYGSPSALESHDMQIVDNNAECWIDAYDMSWSTGYYLNRNQDTLPVSSPALNCSIQMQLNTSVIMANETLDHVELEFSYNSSLINHQINFSIWNFDVNQWHVLNNSYCNGSFFDNSFILNSSFYNASYHVLLRIDSLNSSDAFHVYLEKLKIIYNWTKTAGLIHSNFSKFIDFSFLNRYDSCSEYQDLFNVSIAFTYRFSNFTIYNYHANISINDNNSINDLNVDGTWNEFSHDFTFNSTNESGFWITLNMTNGILEIIDMNYSLIFNCLDINDETRIYQYFKIEPSFSLDAYEKIGDLFINFTHYFSAGDLRYNYANSSLLTLKLIVQSEDSIISSYYYYNSSFSSTLFSLNIRSLLNNNSKEQFLDFSLEIWMNGDESEYTLDNLYLLNNLQKIQVTDNPRTDTDSVEFRDFLVASRDFSYWYFLNTHEINSVDMLNKRTSSLTETFDEENDRYYFIDSANEDDIYQSDIDYDPEWDVSYSFTSDGTSCDLTITYSADMSIDNVTIVLDLSSDDLFMENWTHGAIQNEDTFILELPRMNFTSTEQEITIEGISDVPNARFRNFECQEIPFIDGTAKYYSYYGYIKYTRYSRAYILRGVEEDWEIDGIHYGSNVMTLNENNYFETKPNAFDSSITGSYLKFNADPINSFSVHDYGNGTLYIKIDCNLPIENASVMFALPSENRYEITSDLQHLTSLGEIFDYDYYYFYTSDLEIGVNKIYINYEIHSLNDDLLLFIPLVLLTIAVFGLWYYMKNKEINQKLAEMTERERRAYYKKMQEEGGLLTKAYRSIQDIFRKKTPQEKAYKKREREIKEKIKKEQKKRILR